jgi:hypothetical protein
MELIEGQKAENKQLKLDDKHFSDCVFTDCVLEYHGGPFVFERTRFKSCRYVFFGTAKATVHLLESVGMLPEELGLGMEFSDAVN